MKAQELRIGNLLSYDGTVVQVSNTGSNGFETTKDGVLYGSCNLESYDPIELTEQWLIDFGFKRENRSTISADFWKGINPLTKDWLFSLIWIYDYEKNHPYPLKGYPFYKNGYFEITHVHQLQNLYFALTGEELQL